MKDYCRILFILLQTGQTLQQKSIAFPFFPSSHTSKTVASVKNGFVGKIENITFCTWVSFYFFKKDTFIIYDDTNSTKNNGFGLQFYTETGFLAFGDIWYMYELPPGTKEPETWHHFCFSFDFFSKNVKFFIDDKMVMDKDDKENLENFTFTNNLISRFILGKKFYPSDPPFNGQVTGLNIWSKVLTEKQIKVIG